MDVPAAIALRREPGALVRSLTALLLRLGLGMVFLLAGMEKFQAKKAGAYPGFILAMFDTTKPDAAGEPKHLVVPMTQPMVKLFADVLPYAEVIIGAALIAGVWTPLSAFAAGLLLLNLQFGQANLGKHEAMPGMLTYLLVDAAILWLSPVTSNYLSLDGLFFGWFWAPKGSKYHALNDAEEAKVRATR